MIRDRADRDVLDRIGRLLEEERRLTVRIELHLARMRRSGAADAAIRRTAKTSVSPTIGIVVAATGKIDFGPACASAGEFAAAPASASAPVARMVLRSRWSMGVSPVAFLLVVATKKARAGRGPHCLVSVRSVLDLRRQLAAVGRELAHHLLGSQMFMLASRCIAGIAELLGEFLAGRETGSMSSAFIRSTMECFSPASLLPLPPCRGWEQRRPSAPGQRRSRAAGAAPPAGAALALLPKIAFMIVPKISSFVPMNLKMPGSWRFCEYRQQPAGVATQLYSTGNRVASAAITSRARQ